MVVENIPKEKSHCFCTKKAIILEVSYIDSIFPMEAVLTQDRFTSNILLLQDGGGGRRRRSPNKRGASFFFCACCLLPFFPLFLWYREKCSYKKMMGLLTPRVIAYCSDVYGSVSALHHQEPVCSTASTTL